MFSIRYDLILGGINSPPTPSHLSRAALPMEVGWGGAGRVPLEYRSGVSPPLPGCPAWVLHLLYSQFSAWEVGLEWVRREHCHRLPSLDSRWKIHAPCLCPSSSWSWVGGWVWCHFLEYCCTIHDDGNYTITILLHTGRLFSMPIPFSYMMMEMILI